MCPEPTELLWVGCVTESIWNPKSKLDMLTPQTNSLTFWPKEAWMEWNHLLCLLNIMCFSTHSGSHLTFFVSRNGKRTEFGAMSKRGHDLERWLTDSESKTCESGDAQPVRGGNFLIQFRISSQSREWRWKKKSQPGTRKLDARWFKIGSPNFSSESTREGSSSHQETVAEGSKPK